MDQIKGLLASLKTYVDKEAKNANVDMSVGAGGGVQVKFNLDSGDVLVTTDESTKTLEDLTKEAENGGQE